MHYVGFRWVVQRLPLNQRNFGINLAASAKRMERLPAAPLWIIQHALITFMADLHLYLTSYETQSLVHPF